MKKIGVFLLGTFFSFCALAQIQNAPATITSCPANVALTTSAQSLAVDVNSRQVLISKPSVDMYFSFITTATAGTSPGSTLIPAGAVEVFTVTGTTLSVIASSSGTVNICWVVGY